MSFICGPLELQYVVKRTFVVLKGGGFLSHIYIMEPTYLPSWLHDIIEQWWSARSLFTHSRNKGVHCLWFLLTWTLSTEGLNYFL